MNQEQKDKIITKAIEFIENNSEVRSYRIAQGIIEELELVRSISLPNIKDEEEFEKQLLKRWGFTEYGGVDIGNQLKIFSLLDWMSENSEKLQ